MRSICWVSIELVPPAAGALLLLAVHRARRVKANASDAAKAAIAAMLWTVVNAAMFLVAAYLRSWWGPFVSALTVILGSITCARWRRIAVKRRDAEVAGLLERASRGDRPGNRPTAVDDDPLRMLSTARFTAGATVILPSGATLDGDRMGRYATLHSQDPECHISDITVGKNADGWYCLCRNCGDLATNLPGRGRAWDSAHRHLIFPPGWSI